jgi:hypothetical protein
MARLTQALFHPEIVICPIPHSKPLDCDFFSADKMSHARHGRVNNASLSANLRAGKHLSRISEEKQNVYDNKN